MTTTAAGLAGVTAGATAISTVGKEGVGLTYRGYDIADLARGATFEEVAHLLVHGSLPDAARLAHYRALLGRNRALPGPVLEVLERIPASTHPMDVLRTGTSMLGVCEPEVTFDDSHRVADRLLGAMPSMALYWWHFAREGRRVDVETGAGSTARHVLTLLSGDRDVDPERERCLDVALILYAEHEFNASTFAARVAASTLSDKYSAVTAAIATLKGNLHGGANEAAMELIASYRSPEEAEAGIMERLARKERIMGFGHRVYSVRDPRSDVMKEWSQRLAPRHPDGWMQAVAERIESVMRREKQLFCNLDFYAATAFHFCDIPTELFTPMFVFSRVSGWCAHVYEQRNDNRLIRPEAEYVGPEPRPFVALEDR